MSTTTHNSPHYGWVIVATGILVVLSSLGLGRFALGMLLPAMGESLALSYAQMGFISTGNFVGYMLAVLAIGVLTRRFRTRALITTGLALVAISMLLVSLATGFYQVLVLYFLTGTGSGLANVLAMTLVSHWFARRRRGRAAGLLASGSGFGIVLSGLMVPVVNNAFGTEGWRMSWAVLGLITVAVTLAAAVFIRGRPEDKGLAPYGAEPATEPTRPADTRREGGSALTHGRHVGLIAHLGGIYMLWGFTYAIYATFIVTTLVQEHAFPESRAGLFWAGIGFLSIFSGFLFGTLSDRLGRRLAIILIFALQGGAYVLVAMPPGIWAVYLSVVMFGLTAWGVPGIMAATTGDYMGPERAAAAFGLITFIFGFGQIAGPGLAGLMAEAQQSFAGSYLMAAAMNGVAILLTLCLKRPPRTATA